MLNVALDNARESVPLVHSGHENAMRSAAKPGNHAGVLHNSLFYRRNS